MMTPAHRQLLLWLGGVLIVALTMSRHWVICTHEGGHAHLEIKHPESDHASGHHHGHHHHGHDHHGHHHDGDDHDGDDHDGDHGACDLGDHDHGPGSHVELLVEVGPEQQPDSIELPLLPAFEVALGTREALLWRSAPKPFLAPPATGPPRPPRFLLARATTLLLI